MKYEMKYEKFDENQVVSLHNLTGVSIEDCQEAVKYSLENNGGELKAHAYLRTKFFSGAKHNAFDERVRDWENTLSQVNELNKGA